MTLVINACESAEPVGDQKVTINQVDFCSPDGLNSAAVPYSAEVKAGQVVQVVSIPETPGPEGTKKAFYIAYFPDDGESCYASISAGKEITFNKDGYFSVFWNYGL